MAKIMRITREQLRRIIVNEARRLTETSGAPTQSEFFDFSSRISAALEALGRNDSEPEDPYLWEVFDVPLASKASRWLTFDDLCP